MPNFIPATMTSVPEEILILTHIFPQLISPVSLEITIAPGSRGPNDICLHADTAPINVSISIKQMQLLTQVAYTLLPLISAGESKYNLNLNHQAVI